MGEGEPAPVREGPAEARPPLHPSEKKGLFNIPILRLAPGPVVITSAITEGRDRACLSARPTSARAVRQTPSRSRLRPASAGVRSTSARAVETPRVDLLVEADYEDFE